LPAVNAPSSRPFEIWSPPSNSLLFWKLVRWRNLCDTFGQMRWKQIDTMTCSIARTLSVVGDRWTLLIIRDVFLGIRRFEAIQQDLRLTPHRLSDRLRKLVCDGILRRVAYGKRPPRFEYQ